MGLLEDIDAVPWDTLHHAYGPATDVPDLLRALMIPETASDEIIKAAEVRKNSVFDQVTWTLWGNVYHQGSVWQVTAHTVPLLVTILREGPDDVQTKEFLISYLHNLAMGYPEDIFPERRDPEKDFVEVSGMQDPGTESDYDDDLRLMIWVRDTYEAVERHVEYVLPYLDAADDTVADQAIALCASFPRRAEITVPPLRRVAEVGDRRGATAAVSLAALGAADPETLAKLRAASDQQTAVLGACAAVLYDAANVTPDTLAKLAEPLGPLGAAFSPHASTLSTLVGRCLEKLGPDYRDIAADKICEQLAHASPMEGLSLTQSLLSIVFPDPPPKRASKLTAPQRRALEAIRDHGPFKVADGTFGNYSLLLSGWGLPKTARELRKWLRKSRFLGG